VSFRIVALITLLALAAAPTVAQEPEIESWPLPGTGAGSLATNPADGSIWVFFHQTKNLVSLDSADGSVMLDIPLTLSPTSMAFSPDGRCVFVVGEPLDDQIIDRGVVVAMDASNGQILAELTLEGACNAVYVAPDRMIYVATGMQYAYQGTVYKLEYGLGASDAENESQSEPGEPVLKIVSEAECGKIPWAITEYEGRLYVTDLELQWTEQPDGSMGPPYGAWVWVYDAGTLDFVDREWVGINPNRLRNTTAGVLVACSGSKQSEGSGAEPTLSLIRGPGEVAAIRIGSAGASDLASAPDGSWAVVTLADWAPPAAESRIADLRQLAPERFPEQRRWAYTGDVALITFEDGEAAARRIPVLTTGYLRAVAISADGGRLYAIQSEPERIIAIPVSMLESSEGEPLIEGDEPSMQ
jgi:hypothetical protein